MPRVKSPYDRQDTFLESKSGVIYTILVLMALIGSIVLHLAILWVFLFLLSGPSPSKNKIEDYLIVQLGEVIPAAPAAPDVPVDPNIKGPDVVKAPSSEPETAQPPTPFTPPETVVAQNEVIPIGPEAPPKLEKKSPPPETKVPPVVKEKPKEPPKKQPPKQPNPDAELNKSLEKLRRKVEADKLAATQTAENYNINTPAGAGDGAGSQPAGTPGFQLDPEMANYLSHVRDVIRSNFSWATPPGLDENRLLTRLEVTIRPGGDIVLIKIVKPSGNKNFDDAVILALNKSNPLPQLPSGRPTMEVELIFRPKDLR